MIQNIVKSADYKKYPIFIVGSESLLNFSFQRCPSSIVTDIMSAYLKTTFVPDDFPSAFCLAIHILGTAASRYFYCAHTLPTYASTYIDIVGDTGDGKSFIILASNSIIKQAKINKLNINPPKTGSSLDNHVLSLCRGSYIRDEFSRLVGKELKSGDVNTSELIAIEDTLFTTLSGIYQPQSVGSRSLTRHEASKLASRHVERPAISCMTFSQPESFVAMHIDNKLGAQGTLGRRLVCQLKKEEILGYEETLKSVKLRSHSGVKEATLTKQSATVIHQIATYGNLLTYGKPFVYEIPYTLTEHEIAHKLEKFNKQNGTAYASIDEIDNVYDKITKVPDPIEIPFEPDAHDMLDQLMAEFKVANAHLQVANSEMDKTILFLSNRLVELVCKVALILAVADGFESGNAFAGKAMITSEHVKYAISAVIYLKQQETLMTLQIYDQAVAEKRKKIADDTEIRVIATENAKDKIADSRVVKAKQAFVEYLKKHAEGATIRDIRVGVKPVRKLSADDLVGLVSELKDEEIIRSEVRSVKFNPDVEIFFLN
jgi:hypothetical protein